MFHKYQKIKTRPQSWLPIDTFLYQYFKLTGHSPNDVLVQPVEKLTHDKNSSSRFKIIKRHKTELKWIKLLQTPFPLGFNDNIFHEGNISKMPNFDVFSLLEIRKRKSRSHGIRKTGNGKWKQRAVKRSNTSLKDFSKVLEDRHSMLSFLSSLPISVLRILDTEAAQAYCGCSTADHKIKLLRYCSTANFTNCAVSRTNFTALFLTSQIVSLAVPRVVSRTNCTALLRYCATANFTNFLYCATANSTDILHYHRIFTLPSYISH